MTVGVIEAAQYLKVHRTTVLELIHQRAFPAVKVGRAWVIRKSDLEAYLESRLRPAPSAPQRTTGRPRNALPELGGQVTCSEVRVPKSQL